MIPMKPAAVYARKYLRNCIQAYLEGHQDKNWVDAIVRGSESEAATLLVTELGRFSNTTRYQELLDNWRLTIAP